MTTRPPLRASSERRSTVRSIRHRTPAINDVENRTTPPRHNNALPTRRSSKATALASLVDKKPVAVTPAARPATLARASSTRKRPATAIADATADARPPTKVTVTQPHGELFRTTNGVSIALGAGQDALPSGISTPKANGAASLGLAAPTPAAAGQDKRSLRSHDGTGRLKSDLTIYFANYDDVIADVPREKEFLELDTPIYIIDEPLKTTKPPPPHPTSPEPSRRPSLSPTRSRKSVDHTQLRKASVSSLPAAPSSTAYQTLDYSSIAKHVRHKQGEDPLADSVFFTQHRRAERKEKQLRNIEKERAMHEKVQLERLLDGLQGPDWLKVMGITGVTDGEKKDWEPKRDYFVKEVELLVDKFRIWKEEEKRLRAEKEAALAAREEDEGEEEETEESDETGPSREATIALEQRMKKEPSTPKLRRPPRPHGFLLPILPPEPQIPFVSFYAKPHLRAAALGKHRHGRNATAFGQAIPDFEEHEFCPPEELITIEALRDHARKRRRQLRESKG